MREVKGLVSVSIPFYNSERFLSETIESVLAQTYRDWELLLVDDGSTDRSTEIAREYAANSNEKIRYLEHPHHSNQGLTCSRNLGARKSNGKFLAFLDSDDVWLSQKLSDQVALMNEHEEVGLVYGLSEYWYDWDENRDNSVQNHIPSLAPGQHIYFPPELFTNSYPLGRYGAPCPSSFLLRRTAFDRVAGFIECFNPRTHQMYEDIAFLTKINLDAPVYVSNCCWDKYRCYSASMSHRLEGTTREEAARRFYFHWLREYLRNLGVTDRTIWRAVRKKAWMYWLPIPAAATRTLRRIGNRISR